METEDVSQYRPRSSRSGQMVILPELDVFIHLLILLRMIDEERMEKVRGERGKEGRREGGRWLGLENELAERTSSLLASHTVQAQSCSDALIEKLVIHNRRTLDSLSAKCYFYHSFVYELRGQLFAIRGFLHARLRTATLRHNEEAQVGVAV